jgi:exosome complex RNA-binding protein Rrp4
MSLFKKKKVENAILVDEITYPYTKKFIDEHYPDAEVKVRKYGVISTIRIVSHHKTETLLKEFKEALGGSFDIILTANGTIWITEK